MLTTCNDKNPNEIRQTQTQTLRYCYSSKVFYPIEENASSRLIKNPNRLEIYGAILKQQSKGISTYFENHRTINLIRDAEDSNLLKELFYTNKDCYNDFKDLDFIIVDKFNKKKSNIKSLNRNVSSTELGDHNTKNHDMSFDELLRNKYQAYRKNFKTSEDNTEPYNDNINQTNSYFSFFEHVKTLDQDFYTDQQPVNSVFRNQINMPQIIDTTAETHFNSDFKAKQQKDTVSTHDSFTKTHVNRNLIAADAFNKKQAFTRILSTNCYFDNRHS